MYLRGLECVDADQNIMDKSKYLIEESRIQI